MSTKYSEYEIKETIKCKICDGDFVPGGVRIQLPERTCLWCFSRGPLYRRFTMLWEGLEHLAQIHNPSSDCNGIPCDCKGCKIYRAALPIMNPPASIQTSETKP